MKDDTPTVAGNRHAGDEVGLYQRIVEGLEGRPAYVLVFGIAALFVLSGLATSIAGVVRGEMWQSVLGLLSFVAALIAVLIVVNRVEKPHYGLAAQSAVQVQLNQVRGKIDEPAAGETVGRTIECSGWARELAPGLHLWLATEVNGVIWPKGSEVHVDGNGRWSKTIFEDGALTEFSVSLYVANEDAHKAIADWLYTGQQTDKYERLSKVFGTERIDRVDGLRLSAHAQMRPRPEV